MLQWNSKRQFSAIAAFAALIAGVMYMLNEGPPVHERGLQENIQHTPTQAENVSASKQKENTISIMSKIPAAEIYKHPLELHTNEVVIANVEAPMENIIIQASEVFDDGTLNLNSLGKSKVAQGRLFKNELARVFNIDIGEKLELNMPGFHEAATVSKKNVDIKGNRIAVLDFTGKNNAFMLIYQSSQTGTLNGEIFIERKHYSYIANNEVGVLTDMKEIDAMPID